MDDSAVSAERVRAGDARATARLISMIEREDPSRLAVLKALHAYGGKAHVVGITGPPGAGKSTLTDKLVGDLRGRGRRVAVIAVDPSSPFTGGAILGDRIRMQRHATDDGVYIRSLATRGHLGGLSRAAGEAVRVLDAAGYDDVIIETVGVGQSEVDIVRIADTVVLVSVPGLGDDIQAIKAGVMEIGDVFCVNKADKDGAERVVREIRAMLETAVLNGAATRFTPLFEARSALRGADGAAPSATPNLGSTEQGAFHHIAAQVPGHPNLEIPPVVTTVAETGEGIARLVDEIKAHEAALAATGFLRSRREANLAWELGRGAAQRVLSELERDESREALTELARSVLDRDIDYYDALDALEDAMTRTRRAVTTA
ncbi:MAG TPA: methylmalonyl Co-A mutase-associated GTPase MeaB [Spirochaetia bacterium]|nr:methylmalonyl Co-A mutase-associated GTPase MeaB [Spirochaetales bacterium]HRW23419.1 methylmalonyl Co-A mutase-associated GTPase MeaB [Spirochaetia bacterium]